MPKWALLTGMDTSCKTETLWGELKPRVPARRPLDLEKNGLWLENECEKQTTAGCYPAKTDSSVWLLASVGLIILTLVVLAFVTYFFFCVQSKIRIQSKTRTFGKALLKIPCFFFFSSNWEILISTWANNSVSCIETDPHVYIWGTVRWIGACF